MPTDLDGVHVFKDAKILYGPGKAANAGGVAVSGLEMAQNASHIPWECDAVDARLRQIMQHIHAQCVQYGGRTGTDDSQSTTVDYIAGANRAGLTRVMDAMQGLGW